MTKERRHQKTKDTYLSEIEHRPQVVTDLLTARGAISKLVGFRTDNVTATERPKLKNKIKKVGYIDTNYAKDDEFGVSVVRGSISSLQTKYSMTRNEIIAALKTAHALRPSPTGDIFYLMPTQLPVSGE